MLKQKGSDAAGVETLRDEFAKRSHFAPESQETERLTLPKQSQRKPNSKPCSIATRG